MRLAVCSRNVAIQNDTSWCKWYYFIDIVLYRNEQAQPFSRNLLSFFLKTTQFAYNRIYYQQVFGTAMVSAVITNIVMEDLEQRALATSPVKPLFWKRYVDDVISTVSGNEGGRPLNLIEPSIQFTLERERDRHLPFLNLKVCRVEQGNLKTSVYHKPTHTDKYLAFDSHLPFCHNKSLAKTFLRKAYCPSSSLDSKAEKRKYVFDVLKVNCYIKTFLRNCQKPVTTGNTPDEKEPETSFAVVAYIQGVAKPIKRILNSFNVKAAHEPFTAYFCQT